MIFLFICAANVQAVAFLFDRLMHRLLLAEETIHLDPLSQRVGDAFRGVELCSIFPDILLKAGQQLFFTQLKCRETTLK